MLPAKLDFIDHGEEAFDKWLLDVDIPEEEETEALGIKYEPTQKAEVTAVVPHNRLCIVCNTPLAKDASSQRKTCGGECNKKYRRVYMQQHRSARFPYSCVRCKENFEVGFSMWDEVKLRGMTCAACHAATAPDRGLILSDSRSFKMQQPPCRNCVHSYAEPAAYTGYACRLNARTCVPHIHAKFFVAQDKAVSAKK